METFDYQCGINHLFLFYENILDWVNMTKDEPKEIDINEMVVYNILCLYF